MSKITPALDEWNRLYETIGKLLFDNFLEPTPENFDVCYRYLSGNDSEFNSLVDRAIKQSGGLTAVAVGAIIAQRNAGVSATDLSQMAEDAQGYLEKISEILGQSGDDARDYGSALEDNARSLEVNGSPTTVVASLVDLTKTMIAKAKAAEEELRKTEAQMKALRDDLTSANETANSDPLTGLANRRALETHLRIALENAKRNKSPLAVAICDIDHFKSFNDTHGHQIGDEVIKFIATSLDRGSGPDVLCARYGGEEFVLIFERTTPPDATKVLDKVRTAIAARELKVTNTGQSLGKLSFSGGVASLETKDSPASILKRADDALYRAKETGRNRILIAD